MRYIKEDMQGHIRMWAALAKKHGSPTSEHLVSHEVWQYMGSTDNEHQFRHRDLMVDGIEKGRYNESIPVEEGDFDFLTRYEYTTQLIPLTIGGSMVEDADMNKRGWQRVWADHTDKGSFIVYRRMRVLPAPHQGAVL
jgi:hypothetical protein